MTTGNKLEAAGWRQGTIVQHADMQGALESARYEYDDGIILILASQSCDIANNNIESDPYIELSIARHIDEPKGNLTHNKNPRILHARLQTHTEDAAIIREQHIEIKAFEKITIPKEYFENINPDSNSLLNNTDLDGYVAWLAARYSRPALPTEFNNRIATADPKSKLRKKAKGASGQLSGIYVEITPNTEIPKEENYEVNLLGLVPAGFEGSTAKAEASLDKYAEVMRQADMNVTVVLRKEDDVSIATIKRFDRLYYDDLSFKALDPLPPEVDNIL